MISPPVKWEEAHHKVIMKIKYNGHKMPITELGIWCMLSRFLCFWLFATIWTAPWAPLSMRFSWQEHSGVCCCASSGYLFDPVIKSASPCGSALQVNSSLLLSHQEAPNILVSPSSYPFTPEIINSLSWGWKYENIT